MKHLLNLLNGAGNALVLYPERRAYHVDGHGFQTDMHRLRGDFKAVAHDLRVQLKRESANYRTR
jgi:hypothetical protein